MGEDGSGRAGANSRTPEKIQPAEVTVTGGEGMALGQPLEETQSDQPAEAILTPTELPTVPTLTNLSVELLNTVEDSDEDEETPWHEDKSLWTLKTLNMRLAL